jgi:hypothetical protein
MNHPLLIKRLYFGLLGLPLLLGGMTYTLKSETSAIASELKLKKEPLANVQGSELAFHPSFLTIPIGISWQKLLVSRISENGFHDDVSHSFRFESRNKEVIDLSKEHWTAKNAGTTFIDVFDSSGAQAGEIPVTVLPISENASPDFVDHIQPILTKAGCNNGACHAKPGGRNGFELSVFGYDPESDYQEIVYEGRGRRVFPASPDQSLLLMKPTLRTPHEGGKPLEIDSAFYRLLTNWIHSGMPYHHEDAPKLKSIEVAPSGGRLRNDTSFKLAVSALYEDGSMRDVTHLAEYQSTDKDLLEVDHHGNAQSLNRDGQAVIITRFSGLIAESRWIIPRVVTPDKKITGNLFADLPQNNFIDQHANAYLEQLGYVPSELCSDSEFLRRSALDATGVLPTLEETKQFLNDPRTDKRQRWIRQLLEHRWMGDYWANKWTDLLRPNPDRAGIKSVFMFDQWVRDCFRNNMPYDQFVRSILTLEGSNHQAGPASIYRDKRTPEDRTVLFSQVFLGVRLECAKCHHHPFEKWGQEDFYQTAAFFGTVKQKGAGVSPPISAGTETFYFREGGNVKHPRTEEVMRPIPPGGNLENLPDSSDPREAWMGWMLHPDNPFFAQAVVNRVWSVFFGRGFVNPVDDFRTSNPPVHEPLLQALAKDFVDHGYDLHHLMARIMESRLYQLSSLPNQTNLSDTQYFSRYYRKRLPAEVLLDAVTDITGIPDDLDGLPPGARAIEGWNFKIDSEFMDAFDRPNSSSDPPCERINQPSVVQSLHMMHSEKLQSKLATDKGWIQKLMNSGLSNDATVDEVYLKLLNRYPTEPERSIAVSSLLGENPREGMEDLVWALLNSAEFVFNH